MKTLLSFGAYHLRPVTGKRHKVTFYNVLTGGKVTHQLNLLAECNHPPCWQVRKLSPGQLPAEGWLKELFSNEKEALAAIENGLI